MEDLGVESSMAKELGNERSVGSERSSEEVEEGGEETDPWRSKTRNEIGSCEHTGKDVCHSTGRVCRGKKPMNN